LAENAATNVKITLNNPEDRTDARHVGSGSQNEPAYAGARCARKCARAK
jgi:hypothetical protein